MIPEKVHKTYYKTIFNRHPHMRGPCRTQRDSPGAYVVIIGIPEPTVYLIVHYTEPLYCTTKFFHSSIPISRNALHYATAAPGSVWTSQTVAGDSLTMEWYLQFQHPYTLGARVYMKTMSVFALGLDLG